MARNIFFGLTNRVLLLLAALLLVLSYLSMVINPAKLWLMSIAGLMFVPFLLLNVFLQMEVLRYVMWALVIGVVVLNFLFNTCPNCGKRIRSSCFVCPHCGHEMSE